MDGSDIALHYLLLKNMIPAAKTPSVIVYGLAEFEMDQRSPSSYTFLSYAKMLTRPDDYALYSGDTLNAKMDFVSRQILPIYREHELIADALSVMFNPDNENHKFYAPGPYHITPSFGDFHNPGYGYSGGARAINQCRTEYGPKLKNYRLDPQRLLILGRFLALAQKRHIRVLLINMPVTPLHRSWWGSPQEIAQYRNVVRAIAQQHQATLLDLYDDPEHCFPHTDFIDSHHLNKTGADTVTRMAADRYLAGWLAPVPGAHG